MAVPSTPRPDKDHALSLPVVSATALLPSLAGRVDPNNRFRFHPFAKFIA